MRISRLHVALAGLLTTAALSAQTGEPTVKEVLDRYYEAIGGTETIAAVDSLLVTAHRIEARRAGPHGDVPFELAFRRPSSVRLDIHIDDATGTQSYDGETGWLVWPFTGIVGPAEMEAEALVQFLGENQMISPLVDYEARGHSVALVGRAVVDDVPTFHLEVTLASGDVQNLYLDAKSFLPVQRTTQMETFGLNMGINDRYSDYRETAGLMLARSTQTTVEAGDRTQTVETRIDTVEVNPELPRDHFSMPPNDPESATDGS